MKQADLLKAFLETLPVTRRFRVLSSIGDVGVLFDGSEDVGQSLDLPDGSTVHVYDAGTIHVFPSAAQPTLDLGGSK